MEGRGSWVSDPRVSAAQGGGGGTIFVWRAVYRERGPRRIGPGTPTRLRAALVRLRAYVRPWYAYAPTCGPGTPTRLRAALVRLRAYAQPWYAYAPTCSPGTLASVRPTPYVIPIVNYCNSCTQALAYWRPKAQPTPTA